MRSSRLRRTVRGIAAGLVIACVLALLASPAVARKAYVANSGGGSVTAIETLNGFGKTIPIGGAPVDVAITPDASRAYVVDSAGDSVSVIDTATDAVVAGPIPVGEKPLGIAISPDGLFAYVSNSGDDTVSVLNTTTNAEAIPPIPVGPEPDGVAISPDGRYAFVAQRGGDLAAIDRTTSTVVTTIADPRGPSRIAIGPRGGRGFVTDAGGSTVTAFNPVTRSAIGPPVPVGSEPAGIAIEPSGGLAYAASPSAGSLTAISTSLNAPLGGALPFAGATGVAFKPDGAQGYVTNATGSSVSILDPTRNLAVGAFAAGAEPAGIAVVPNRGPVASFWISPTRKRAKKVLTFHAGGSMDPDGSVANYVWDFGDRGRIETDRPTSVHRFRRPGTYSVSLVVTDEEGCSTETVYTGQTASCTGSVAAVDSALVKVLDATGPVLRLRGGKRQPVRGRLKVFARCPREACAARARGVVITTIEEGKAKKKRRLRLVGAGRSGRTRSWRRLVVRVPKRTRRLARRALRRGGKAKARVAVAVRDREGQITVRTRTVKLVIPD